MQWNWEKKAKNTEASIECLEDTNFIKNCIIYFVISLKIEAEEKMAYNNFKETDDRQKIAICEQAK